MATVKSMIPAGHVNFTTYLRKLLKKVHPKIGITTKAMIQLNGLVFNIGKLLAKEAEGFAKAKGRQTISAVNVQSAAQVVYQGQLASHAVKAIEAALNAVTDARAGGSKGKEAIAASNLDIAPSRAARLLASRGKGMRVASETSLALAAALEYVALELLELAGDVARDMKKVRINVRCIFGAIQSDEEFIGFFHRHKLALIGGGVFPGILPALLPKRTDSGKKKYSKKATKGGPRKFRQGTVAIREVTKYQKMSGCLMFAREPFQRLIREIAQDLNHQALKTDLNFSAKSLELIQLYVEAHLVKVIANANTLVAYAKKQTITPNEITIARKLMGEAH